MELPSIRCLMAFPLGDGEISRVTHLVDLEEAFIRMGEGWQIVGPDPEDWEAYLSRKAYYETLYDTRRWWKRR